MSLQSLLIVAGALFAIGFFGVLTRRHVIAVLMSVELMLNAVNVTLVALSRYVLPLRLLQTPDPSPQDLERVVSSLLAGQAFAIFIVIVAAAEVALGLAIVMALYRTRATVDLTEYTLMKR